MRVAGRGFVSSWRTALRVARREARRSKGRSALVVAMIALPVLCLSFAAVSYDMFTLSPAEKADRTMGTTDARIQWPNHVAISQDPTGGVYGSPRPSQPTPEEMKPGTEAELAAKLPGSTFLALRRGTTEVHTADGVGKLNAIAVDATSPKIHGYLTILSGRAPTTATEVALSEKAVKRIGVGIGGTVRSGDNTRSYTVVGLVEFPSQLEQTLLFAPMTEESPKGFDLPDNSWLVDTPGPVTWTQVGELNQSGIVVTSRDVLAHPPSTNALSAYVRDQLGTRELAIGTLVAGLSLLEIVLLAGPAFAVSARRRQRQLALVAANGGTPAHVRRIVLADGVVLGLVGAAFGIAFGIVGAFVARPFVEDLLAHARAGAYRVFPTALIAIAALAVVTGLLAALVPAFITGRQNVVTSLGGRRGITRSKKRWLFLGLAMVAIGSAIVMYGAIAIHSDLMLVGLVIGELGLVLCTPSLVGLIARIGRVLPLAPRIALRDAARNRAAAAPAISAVMAAVAGAVALGVYFDSNRLQQEAGFQAQMPVGYASIYVPDPVHDPKAANGSPAPTLAVVEREVRATLPVKEVHPMTVASCPTDPSKQQYCDIQVLLDPAQVCPWVAVLQNADGVLTKEQMRAANADPRCSASNAWGSRSDVTIDDGPGLATITGASPEDIAAATEVLRNGGVVVCDPRYLTNGKATVAVVTVDTSGNTSASPEQVLAAAPKLTFPAYALSTGIRAAGAIMSNATAESAHFSVAQRGLMVATTRMPTQAEEDRFTARMNDLQVGGFVQHPGSYQVDVMLWVIMAAAGLITLGAAGIGTGLAAADGRADLSTLASVGASPRLRRGLSLSQSAVIAGLGSLLGAAAGLGTAIAVMVALNRRYADLWPGPRLFPLTVPWISLGVALVLVPALAMLGAGLLTRSRLPIERRT